MNKVILTAGICAFIASCGMFGKTAGSGDTRTKPVVMLNSTAYLLTERAPASDYGFKSSNPVKVGGVKEMQGPANERKFLNALLGPQGQTLTYRRIGSCCHFKTPNGSIDHVGLLDVYKVWWMGASDTFRIYINMYDKGDLYIPKGFTARKNAD